MQGLLDAPRTLLNAAEVRALLSTTPQVKVTAGLEMLTAQSVGYPTARTTKVTDVSDILVADGSHVSYDNTAKIGGSCSLQIDPQVWTALNNPTLLQAWPFSASYDYVDLRLYWGNPRTRLRPYVTLTAPGVTSVAKFYLGVYIPASPTAPMDSTAPLYSVTCYDQTAILDVPITGSLSYAAGTNVITTVQGIVSTFDALLIREAPLTVTVDAAGAQKFLAAPMAFSDSGTTYLDVINALLNAGGYNNLWADCYGGLNATQYLDPRTRNVEWVFDATDPTGSIVDPASTWSPDIWNVPNQWVFVQNGIPGTPTEGSGQYTVTNQSAGPSSVDKQFGRIILSYHQLDATDQGSLVTQGTAIVVQESAIGETWQINTAPFPLAGYQDVISFIPINTEVNLFHTGDINSTVTRKCVVQSWTLPLDGSDQTWTWGTIG